MAHDDTAMNAPAAPQPPDATGKGYAFEFRGSAGEYFKIWMVNILLTVLTLGIFSAWAKVRNQRYFYGNTFLDGSNFEYHASPLSILFSRIALLVILVGGATWAGIDVLRNLWWTLALIFFLPWALVSRFSFNARYSSYRSVRFSFNKSGRTYLTAVFFYLYLMLLLGPLLAGELMVETGEDEEIAGVLLLLVAGLLLVVAALPWVARAYHRFKAANHCWGREEFGFAPPPARAYIYGIWGIPVFLAAVGAAAGYLSTTSSATLVTFATAVVIAGAAILALPLISAFLFQLYWQAVRLPGGGRVACNFHATDFAVKILLVNYFAIVLSLGLLYPWAKVRKVHFLAQHMALVAREGEMERVLQSEVAHQNALGAEFDAAEGFDFDVGLI